jgi:peptidoglycan L-alanyl-D-glutamate endopeptidase CwlK
MINSRDIKDLQPKVAQLCTKFVLLCKEAGIDVIITSTYRDIESQNKIYAQGRTASGPRVTNAKGGESFHNYKVAFDFVPIVNGKADWNNTMTFRKCGEIAESISLEWAGRWRNFKELAHCQYTQGLTLSDFKSGKQIT